jgi:sugar phosphate isomerase/epimerase
VTFKKVWPGLVRFARDNGVKIAIENCPMIFSGDEWPGGNNLAYNPANWRRMFEIIPDDNFGLNFDPSHLIWQFIDIPRAIREFGKRIFHVHAKDLEIKQDGLYEQGVMSAGMGWQVPRLCGLGEVNWSAFFGALYAVGYDDVVSIEHEDRGFEGSIDKVKRGFLIARDNLLPFIH